VNRLAWIAGCVALAAFAALGVRSATAADVAPVSVSGAWVRWLPNDLPAAGYATLKNEGATPLRLTGASSPDYAGVMLHRSISENGVERMVKADGIDIPPGQSFALAPGGYHLMLMRAKHPVHPGDTVTLHFEFADGAGVDAKVAVKPASATAAD
jgi:periplasmic copper chaperone A